jgi:hypothetical protein
MPKSKRPRLFLPGLDGTSKHDQGNRADVCYNRGMNSRNVIEPPGGTVVLRGIVVEIDGAVGQAFVTDVVRHIEDLMPADALRSKYGLLDDAAYEALGSNEALQRSIAAAKTRRIHSGEAARERAQHLFLTAPTVLGEIVRDASMSPRHRIEAARELRQVAANGPTDERKNDKERFHIVLNFGASKINKTVELPPKPEVLTIEHNESEDGEFGF